MFSISEEFTTGRNVGLKDNLQVHNIFSSTSSLRLPLIYHSGVMIQSILKNHKSLYLKGCQSDAFNIY